jgi:hypothetical protein
MSKTGRPLKVQPEEIKNEIRKADRITIKELSNIFDICPGTVEKRLRDLRDCSEPVFFDKDGLFLIDAIENINDIHQIEKYRDWCISTLIGIMRCSAPIKPLAIEFKNKFKELTTPEERREMKRFFLKMEKMIEYFEIDDED